MTKGAIDEFGAGVGIQKHDADVDMIERRRQPLGSGMMSALAGQCIGQPFLQKAGDGGRACRGDRERREANQVREVKARRGAMVEEKQRR